ncbi:ABC transporter permease [Paenibacillus sp. SYP-B4298]|uniref:ABC transporter permease n=1 Tax=Paenibacillus sp. SYP-B4298 TaxID=2996034 RepID=UPI0022DE2555|nr:ABC transporter permease subunit [Paenibacillus sp. SYP-B4298]
MNRHLYLLALPGVLFLLIFAYLPMFGHIVAFKRFRPSDGLWGSEWVGLDNFKFFFGSDDWLHITLNTLFINSLFIVFTLGIALVLAVFINELRHALYKRLAQSVIFLPYFVSWLVVSFMTYAVFNTSDGVLNKLLAGLGREGYNWYGNAELWPYILTMLFVWKMSGYVTIIFFSAITAISGEYYESAKLDGASRFQQILHITLPLLRPTLVVLLLLQIGRIFYGDFGMIYGIIGDNPILIPTTDVIDTFSFRALRQLGNFSMAGAVVLYQAIMGLITIVLFNWVAKKIDSDSSLF